MAKIPKPHFPNRTEWMVVTWLPDQKRWWPLFKPFDNKSRKAALKELAEVRKRLSANESALVMVRTTYGVVPLEEEGWILPKGERT